MVPDGTPKTKPRAYNVGLAEAKEEFLVIYDAEDHPEPNQLKKSVAVFRRAEKDLGCSRVQKPGGSETFDTDPAGRHGRQTGEGLYPLAGSGMYRRQRR